MKYQNMQCMAMIFLLSSFFIQTSQGSKSSGESNSSSNQKSSGGQIDNLINEFEQKTNAIPEKPQPQKSQNSTEKKSPEEQSKENKEAEEKKKKFQKALNEAYDAYKKLFDYNKEHKPVISKDQNDKVKKSARKLFSLRNIQNMVWHGNVLGQNSGTSGQNTSSKAQQPQQKNQKSQQPKKESSSKN
ncbi:MAG: hypothetical protein ACXWL5_04200 [Candidatus Chromulinivorax sp.]